MRRIDPARHQERRQQILKAAGRCFMRRGFRGASVSDICAEAGISPGHLYHYFASKEAIIEAMAKANLARAAERFGQIAEGTDAVAVLGAEIERAKLKRNASSLLFEMLAEAARNPAMARILRHHSRGMRSLFAGLVRKGQDAGQIDRGLDADAVAALLIGVIDSSKALAIRNFRHEGKKSAELTATMIARFLRPH
jgi:AcrR family transcriptional regulator